MAARNAVVELTRFEIVAALYASDLPTGVRTHGPQAAEAAVTAVRRLGLARIAELGISLCYDDRLGYFEVATGIPMPSGLGPDRWDAERLEWAQDAQFSILASCSVTVANMPVSAPPSAA